jgi:hypothetical protein
VFLVSSSGCNRHRLLFMGDKTCDAVLQVHAAVHHRRDGCRRVARLDGSQRSYSTSTLPTSGSSVYVPSS